MKTVPLAELPTNFRKRATFLRENAAAVQAATAWEKAAIEVEAALEGHAYERLTLAEVAIKSGFTLGHLRRLHRAGKLPMTEDGCVLRRHVPKKPGHGVAENEDEGPSSKTQLARAVAGGAQSGTPKKERTPAGDDHHVHTMTGGQREYRSC